MKKRKLTVQFEKSNIIIKEGGNVLVGIPYRFDLNMEKITLEIYW